MLSKEGEIYEGTVTGLTSFGAFVKLPNGETGMVHISEVAPVFVKDIGAFLSEGQEVKVKVLSVSENNKISLSIKQAAPKPAGQSDERRKPYPQRPAREPERQGFRGRPQSQPAGPMSFEDMMAKFKADSEEKISALKRGNESGRGPRRGNKS